MHIGFPLKLIVPPLEETRFGSCRLLRPSHLPTIMIQPLQVIQVIQVVQTSFKVTRNEVASLAALIPSKRERIVIVYFTRELACYRLAERFEAPSLGNCPVEVAPGFLLIVWYCGSAAAKARALCLPVVIPKPDRLRAPLL